MATDTGTLLWSMIAQPNTFPQGQHISVCVGEQVYFLVSHSANCITNEFIHQQQCPISFGNEPIPVLQSPTLSCGRSRGGLYMRGYSDPTYRGTKGRRARGPPPFLPSSLPQSETTARKKSKLSPSLLTAMPSCNTNMLQWMKPRLHYGYQAGKMGKWMQRERVFTKCENCCH